MDGLGASRQLTLKHCIMQGYHVVLILLGILTGYCIYASIFNVGAEIMNTWRYKPLIVFMGAAVYIQLLVLAYFAIGRMNTRGQQILTAGLFAAMLCGLLAFGLVLKCYLAYDISYLHRGAIDIVENGKIITSEYYFSRYPYQQASSILLAIPYAFQKLLGIGDYHIFGTVFNVIMIVLAAIFSYKIVLELKGQRAAILSVLIFATNPIFYLYASYHYTDILCLPFLMGGTYLSLLAENVRGKRKALFYFGTGLAICCGIQIRATVGIILIAIIIILWIRNRWKQALINSGILLFGIIVAATCWGLATYVWGANLNPDEKYPPTHFIMMGLTEESDGRYNAMLDSFTEKLPTYEDKVAGTSAALVDKVKQSGLKRLSALMLVKIAGLWTDGYALAKDILNRVEQYGAVYEYTIGEKGIISGYVAQFVRCSIFLCMPFALLEERGKNRLDTGSAIVVSFFGTALFYLFWQSTGRFSVFFLPCLLILQTLGLVCLIQVLQTVHYTITDSSKTTKAFGAYELLRILRTINIVLAILIVGIGVANLRPFIGEVAPRSETRAIQPLSLPNAQAELTDHGVAETFLMSQPFNQINIQFFKKDDVPDDQKYTFTISNPEGQVLSRQEFLSNQIRNNSYYTFSIDTITPIQETAYTIDLYASEQYEKNLALGGFATLVPEYDPYIRGYRTLNGNVSGDITFNIKEVLVGTFVSKRVYAVLWGGSLALEGIILYSIHSTLRKVRKGRTQIERNDN